MKREDAHRERKPKQKRSWIDELQYSVDRNHKNEGKFWPVKGKPVKKREFDENGNIVWDKY